MSIVISVHSPRAFKEFVLPSVQNSDTTLILRRDIFGFREDEEISMENVDGQWYFRPKHSANGIRLQQYNKEYAGSPICHGDYFQGVAGGQVLIAIMVTITEDRFEAYRKYRLRNGRAKIGTAPECGICYSFEYAGNQYISLKSIELICTAEGMQLADSSKNGVYVNDKRIQGTVRLQFGDRIDIWGLNMVALGNVIAIRPNKSLKIDPEQFAPADVEEKKIQEDAAHQKIKYHRSPRNIGKLHRETIAIEQPPAPHPMGEQPLFMVIGPALTMTIPMLAGSVLAVAGASSGGLYMYTGIITSVLSAVIGVAWALVNLNFSRKQSKEAENHRFTAYSDYLVRITDSIRQKYEQNSTILKEAYPPAQQVLADGCKGEHLWERNANHEDFLTYRLGLGDIPFQVNIQIPPEKFELELDSLRDKPRMILENYKTLHNVPYCVDLYKERLIGLVGGKNKAGARKLMQLLVAQIAAQNCYTDVKLVFVYDLKEGDDASKWEFCRWLPHVWSENHKVRYVAANKNEASDVFYDLAAVLRQRSEDREHRSEEYYVYKPWYVLFLEDSSLLENEPVAKYLLNPRQSLGATTILMADNAEDLPNACDCIIRNDAEFCGMYHAASQQDGTGKMEIDTVQPQALEEFARYLANVQVNEVEVGGEIPNAVTFFEMYGVEHPRELCAAERWKKNRNYENMRAMIGLKSGNQPCCLDVHEKYHGPHGLLAGTTGSGKSETLQTYILSLCLNFSPYDVGLFLIDYKGGGMGNLFTGLPHVLGQISNLSGGQVRRAMVSIKSENRRRQRIFNESGVNNINLYTTLFKNGEVKVPVPHLFIIIDEFAELKREQPDFMRELISVAQVGRSLGVHLILATQKPSGTVDENIWSNSKFRICLRVQDRQDSVEMLHKPDAAYLVQAGRGFLQVGNDEVFEAFQSGWSGAVYDEEAAGNKQVLAKMLTNTGKTALVGSYIKRNRKEEALHRWIGLLLSCADKIGSQKETAAWGENRNQIICDTMYEYFEYRKIDYPRNDFNTRALMNLIQLADEAKRQGIYGERRCDWIQAEAFRRHSKLPEQKEKTQLDAMVSYLAQTAKENKYLPLAPLWMEPLPKALYLRDVDGWPETAFQNGEWPQHDSRWELSAIIGKADDPDNQTQLPVEINFTRGGHLALVGASGTGKSVFTQTLIYSLVHRYSPQYLNLYILDFSSRSTSAFEGLAHVGGILYESDLPQVGKLFYLLENMMNERKKLFRGGSFEQYVMVNGSACPAVLLVIDNMAGFREKTGEAYDELLMRFTRESANYGIYLFVTGAGFNINEIPSRIGDNFRSTITLELTDAFQYSDILRSAKPEVLPEQGTPGRGLLAIDGRTLEYQTALALQAKDDYERIEAIRNTCAGMNRAWNGKKARKIPLIPEKPVLDDMMSREEMPALLAESRLLPIGYNNENAGLYSVDLSRICSYVVSGRAHSGKTNLLRLMMRMAKEKEMHLFVLDADQSPLKNEAGQLGAEYFCGVEEITEFVSSSLAPNFVQRNRRKKELLGQGLENEAIYKAMSSEEAWIIFIDNLGAFTDMVNSAKGMEKNLPGAFANLVGKGYLHNIFFVAGLNQEETASLKGDPVFTAFIKDRTGIHLGGKVTSQWLFEYQGMPFQEQDATCKPGIGLVPPKEDEAYVRVILPQIK